jgi:hypothetical protein
LQTECILVFILFPPDGGGQTGRKPGIAQVTGQGILRRRAGHVGLRTMKIFAGEMRFRSFQGGQSTNRTCF